MLFVELGQGFIIEVFLVEVEGATHVILGNFERNQAIQARIVHILIKASLDLFLLHIMRHSFNNYAEI